MLSVLSMKQVGMSSGLSPLEKRSTVKRGEEGHGGEEGQSVGKCLDAKFYKPDK